MKKNKGDLEKLRQRVLELLKKSKETNYQIGKDTGITEATIGNYRNKKTKPTEANANILVKYLTGKDDMLKVEIQQETVKPPAPTQLEIDFSKIAEANLKIANAVESMTVTAERNSRTMEKTTDNSTKLIAVNTELIEKLLSAIDRIEKKIDKKGAVAGAGDVAKPAAQG
jgi:predicted transcriptional regulator